MSNVTCSSCGAEIADGTKFCRQCGQHSIDAANSAEAVTQVLEPQGKDVSTRRLNAQATNPTDYALSEPVYTTDPATKSLHPARQKRRAMIRKLVILSLVVLAGIVAIGMWQSRSATSISKSLVYPNSETIVDMKSVEGSALQLRTRDPFNKVVDWYVTNLRPTKTMKLTETNILLKAGNITTVIAAEDNETNIVIKQAAER